MRRASKTKAVPCKRPMTLQEYVDSIIKELDMMRRPKNKEQ